jgi:hypothetical protein
MTSANQAAAARAAHVAPVVAVDQAAHMRQTAIRQSAQPAATEVVGKLSVARGGVPIGSKTGMHCVSCLHVVTVWMRIHLHALCFGH